MKRFAVSLNCRDIENGLYDMLSHWYVAYLDMLDIAPLFVPNNLADPRAYIDALAPDGLLLTGGSDIDPVHYGQPNTHSLRIMAGRDKTEFALLDWAIANDAPVLGICRGIQAINVYLGGGLVQDIPTELHGLNGHRVNHDETTHPVTVVDDQFADLIGTHDLTTNSFHHQGATSALLAPDLVAFACSEADGIIEGVYHRTQPIIGVQWHPERPTPSRESDLALFRHFLTHGAFWSA